MVRCLWTVLRACLGFYENVVFVMLSPSKHLYRFVVKVLITSAVEMLRQAQHDVLFKFSNTFLVARR